MVDGLLKARDHAFPVDWLRSRQSLGVVLVQPPARDAVESLFPQTETEEGIGFKPPLGILYIAAHLERHSDHRVSALDAQVERWDVETLVDEILKQDPQIVGITAWTDFWYSAHRTAQLLKSRAPGVHIVIGGPHVSIYPEICLTDSAADSIVLGDGEIPMLLLVNALANGLTPRNIPGVHFKEHGVREGDDKWFIDKDLDALPHPNRRLLPIKKYSSVLARQRYVTTMITSRGCPYKCTFCKLNFQKTLQRSAASVVDEFSEIRDLGISEVEVYDDTFTWSPRRVKEICEGLIERDLGIEWAIRDRVTGVKAENLDLLRKAGCSRIHLGVESGSDKTLQTIKKSITLAQARNAVALVKAAGFTTLTYFMIGLPGESRDDVRETIDFAMQLDADYTEFNICIPYAGTEMYETALKDGIITSDYWQEFARAPVPNYQIPQLIENLLSKAELMQLRDEAIRRFYFRPKVLARELAGVRSVGEFTRKAKMGMSLFRQSVLPLLVSGKLHDSFKPAKDTEVRP
jgi:anaerobic magnesium-protoporphyrin IX monomethyl ester cyclase